jgi:hypothetical protein
MQTNAYTPQLPNPSYTINSPSTSSTVPINNRIVQTPQHFQANQLPIPTTLVQQQQHGKQLRVNNNQTSGNMQQQQQRSFNQHQHHQTPSTPSVTISSASSSTSSANYGHNNPTSHIPATDEFLQPTVHMTHPLRRTPSITASSPASTFNCQTNQHGNGNRIKTNSKRFPAPPLSTQQQQQHQLRANNDQIDKIQNSTNILASAAASMVNYFNSAINNSPSPGSVSIITISSDSEDDENKQDPTKQKYFQLFSLLLGQIRRN